MPKMRTSATRTDRDRAARLMAAWHYGDKYALDTLLDEAMADPTGTPGLLFALVDFAVRLGEQCYPDFPELLQSRLIDSQDDGRGQE